MDALELKQGDKVISRIYDLSANQLILLLNYYRGTENMCPQMGTDEYDLQLLVDIGLLKGKQELFSNDLKYSVTPIGHSYLNNILSVCILADIETKLTVEPKK